MKQPIFAPLGDSQIVAVTASDQRITLPTLGTPGPAIALVSQSADIKSLWVKLGNSSVVGSVTTSMRVLPGSIENPTYIGVGNSETHLSIFGENPGNLILTPGRLFFCDNPADSVDTDAIQDAAVTTAKIADAAVTIAKIAGGAIGSGYIRIGTIQIAWGTYTSASSSSAATTSFPVAFDAAPSVILTPESDGAILTTQPRFSVAGDITTTQFAAQTWSDAGARSSVPGNYIAIGTWS